MIRYAMYGLGGRVSVIAHAMAQDDSPEVEWIVNAHCPARYQEVFPDGIPRVRMVNRTTPSGSGSVFCRPAAVPVLRQMTISIFRAMQLDPVTICDLGVHWRGHRGPEGEKLAPFLSRLEWLLASTEGPIAVLADSDRSIIAGVVGDRALPQESREMDHDLDRQPEDIRPYMADWARILACRVIATNCPHSLALWPRTMNPDHLGLHGKVLLDSGTKKERVASC